MDAGVGRELGMKGGGEQVAFFDQNGRAIAGSEDLNVGTDPGDARRADEDHLERTAGKGGRGRENGGVDLPTIGVALDRDVEGAEGSLSWVLDVLRKQDAAGAGSEGGMVADEVGEGIVESVAFQVSQEGGGLAAGDDEAVEAGELIRAADEYHFSSELTEHGGMNVKGALKRQDADG